MFLHPQPPSPAPSMAQITTAPDSSLPPIFGSPFYVSPSTAAHNSPPTLPPFYDRGLLCTMMNNQGCGDRAEFSKARKRERDEDANLSPWFNKKISTTPVQLAANGSNDHDRNNIQCCMMCSTSSPGDDISVTMLREQQEVDLFILMQMERLRAEVEERRRACWHNLFHTVEQGMQRILRHKDEELARMTRKNMALEDKVKILLMEGQIWKSVAQTNEAAATSLRRELELAAQAREEGEGDINGGEASDSASCCDGGGTDGSHNCHGCHDKEISVLVLPCRHLCLCSDCDPRFGSCPLCMCAKTASIKVHMS